MSFMRRKENTSAVSKLKIQIEDSECHLWKDEDDGHLYVEIECPLIADNQITIAWAPVNGIHNSKDIKRLISFLDKCHKRMCVKTA
jgi:hypothetical protein